MYALQEGRRTPLLMCGWGALTDSLLQIPKAMLVCACLARVCAGGCFSVPCPPEAEGGEVQFCVSNVNNAVMSPETFISLIHASNKIALHFS